MFQPKNKKKKNIPKTNQIKFLCKYLRIVNQQNQMFGMTLILKSDRR